MSRPQPQPSPKIIKAHLALLEGYLLMNYLGGIADGAAALGGMAANLISSADFKRRSLVAKTRALINHDHALCGE